jgi:hypothetical protein
MDKWNDDQLRKMKLGGNVNFQVRRGMAYASRPTQWLTLHAAL